MTTTEFSDQFDVLYNSITSNMAPGFDDYEKSVFLTKAQEEIVRAYFNPNLNKTLEGFDSSSKRLVDFSMLMRTTEGEEVSGATLSGLHPGTNIKLFKVPDDILMYINEVLVVSRYGHTAHLAVVPLNFTEFNRVMARPFKYPNKSLAWRLTLNGAAASASEDTDDDTETKYNTVEIIPGLNDTITKYIIRYVVHPKPIILSSLADAGVSIEGETDEMTCELDPAIHQEILQRAVELAKAVYMADINTLLSLGLVSETEFGLAVSPQK